MATLGILIRESGVFVEKHVYFGNEQENLRIIQEISRARDVTLFREDNPVQWAIFLSTNAPPGPHPTQAQWNTLRLTASPQDVFLASRFGLV